MRRRIVLIGLILAMLVGSLTGCSMGDTKVVFHMNFVGRNHVFSINGERCTKKEALLYLCNYQNIYGHAYGLNLWEYDYSTMDDSQTLEQYVKDVTLSTLADVFCMKQLADKEGITLTEVEEQKVAQAAEDYFATLSRKERSYMGVDKNDIENFYEKYALAQKLYETLTQGISEEVSDDEARVLRVRQIYVTKEDVAKQIESKLQNGESFDLLASRYNEASVTERTLARGEYPKKVEDVVYLLEDQEYSGMIEVENGFYFVKCINKYEETLTEQNKQNIIEKRRKEQFEDKLADYIKDSHFKLNKKFWNKLKINKSEEIKTDQFFEIYDTYFTESYS